MDTSAGHVNARIGSGRHSIPICLHAKQKAVFTHRRGRKLERNESKLPTVGHGKICYLEIPALDIQRSAAFYEIVFGWSIRRRDDGSVAFDDGVGEVSGTWVLGRPPMEKPWIVISIMIDSVADALDLVVANGGTIAQPIGADAPEITAHFHDPAGNVLGIYQEPHSSAQV